MARKLDCMSGLILSSLACPFLAQVYCSEILLKVYAVMECHIKSSKVAITLQIAGSSTKLGLKTLIYIHHFPRLDTKSLSESLQSGSQYFYFWFF